MSGWWGTSGLRVMMILVTHLAGVISTTIYKRRMPYGTIPCSIWAYLLACSVVLGEYSKFQIESNSYFSIRFDSKREQLFEIFEYLPSPIFLLIYKFSVNRWSQKYRLPVALFNYRLSIYRIKHACAHAQHVFDLCRRSHQHQMPSSSLPAPHLCSGRGRGGDAYMQSKYMQRLWLAENEIASQ